MGFFLNTCTNKTLTCMKNKHKTVDNGILKSDGLSPEHNNSKSEIDRRRKREEKPARRGLASLRNRKPVLVERAVPLCVHMHTTRPRGPRTSKLFDSPCHEGMSGHWRNQRSLRRATLVPWAPRNLQIWQSERKKIPCLHLPHFAERGAQQRKKNKKSYAKKKRAARIILNREEQ